MIRWIPITVKCIQIIIIMLLLTQGVDRCNKVNHNQLLIILIILIYMLLNLRVIKSNTINHYLIYSPTQLLITIKLVRAPNLPCLHMVKIIHWVAKIFTVNHNHRHSHTQSQIIIQLVQWVVSSSKYNNFLTLISIQLILILTNIFNQICKYSNQILVKYINRTLVNHTKIQIWIKLIYQTVRDTLVNHTQTQIWIQLI